MERYVICFVTVDTPENAVKIASSLLEEKIVACVNIIDSIRSLYWWEGKIFDEKEVLLIIKTRMILFESLKKRVKELHSYEIPEIVCLEIKNALPEYLQWIHDSTKP
jgi:periplasmic divalent cation tolerance protein